MTIDPTAADEPCDRITIALGLLTERNGSLLDAVHQLLRPCQQIGMSVVDSADLILAEARVAHGYGR